MTARKELVLFKALVCLKRYWWGLKSQGDGWGGRGVGDRGGGARGGVAGLKGLRLEVV